MGTGSPLPGTRSAENEQAAPPGRAAATQREGVVGVLDPDRTVFAVSLVSEAGDDRVERQVEGGRHQVWGFGTKPAATQPSLEDRLGGIRVADQVPAEAVGANRPKHDHEVAAGGQQLEHALGSDQVRSAPAIRMPRSSPWSRP